MLVEVLGLGAAASRPYPFLYLKATQTLAMMVRSDVSRAFLRQHRGGRTLDALVRGLRGTAVETNGGASGPATRVQRSLLSETMLLVSRLMWDKEFHDWALKSPPSSTTGRWELMMEACLLVAKQSSHALRQVLERESLENPRAAVYSLCDIAGGDGDTGIGDEQQQKLEWPAARALRDSEAARRQRQLERAAAVPVTVEATETGTQLASAGAAGGEEAPPSPPEDGRGTSAVVVAARHIGLAAYPL